MTGYENLEHELLKEFHASKVKSNKDFIQAIIRILTENPEDRVALEIASQKRKEAEELMHEAEDKLYMVKEKEREAATALRLTEIANAKIEATKEEIEKISETIKECETPEARDKIRIANFFCSKCDRRLDGVAFARGLSNILGNGGTKTVSKYNYELDSDDPVLDVV